MSREESMHGWSWNDEKTIHVQGPAGARVTIRSGSGEINVIGAEFGSRVSLNTLMDALKAMAIFDKLKMELAELSGELVTTVVTTCSQDTIEDLQDLGRMEIAALQGAATIFTKSKDTHPPSIAPYGAIASHVVGVDTKYPWWEGDRCTALWDAESGLFLGLIAVNKGMTGWAALTVAEVIEGEHFNYSFTSRADAIRSLQLRPYVKLPAPAVQ